jgi:hypothetical protein
LFIPVALLKEKPRLYDLYVLHLHTLKYLPKIDVQQFVEGNWHKCPKKIWKILIPLVDGSVAKKCLPYCQTFGWSANIKGTTAHSLCPREDSTENKHLHLRQRSLGNYVE